MPCWIEVSQRFPVDDVRLPELDATHLVFTSEPRLAKYAAEPLIAAPVVLVKVSTHRAALATPAAANWAVIIGGGTVSSGPWVASTLRVTVRPP